MANRECSDYKAHIQGREDPVLFVINYATMIDDDDELESLAAPFQSMKHGVTVDLTPTRYGGTGKLKVDGQEFPFAFDGEKLYYKIEKPNEEDLDLLECFELTSPLPDDDFPVNPRRNKKKTTHEDTPIIEWRKRLAWAPEDIVIKTLEKTTQFYLGVGCDNRDNPRRHLISRVPGLRYPRQNEKVATDTFFPSVT